MVIGFRKPSRNPLVAEYHQAQWENGLVRSGRRAGEALCITRGGRTVRRDLARENRVRLGGTESLHAVALVIDRGIELPPQAVVQRQTRLNFPAVLREEINRRCPDVFSLRRTLIIRGRQAQEVVREEVSTSESIWGAAAEGVKSVHFENEHLIKPHPAHITAEFEAVLADHLAEIVRPLEAIPNLRQLPLEVVADGEAARNDAKRHAFAARAQAGCDAVFGVGTQ